jgi:phage terminase large subunit
MMNALQELAPYLTPQENAELTLLASLSNDVTATGAGEVIPYELPYVRGGCAKLYHNHAPEIVLHGPYETGKTFGVIAWFHWLMCQYPNAKGLWLRDVYKDLISSACETFERKVLATPLDDPQSPVRKFGGEKPEKYMYRNGSEILLKGLDRPGGLLSAEFDFIYINQAEEIDLAIYEILTGRATGRAGNTPFTQIMCDCNPGAPDHWILKRHSAGNLELYQQMHEDNPALFDDDGNMTEQGKITMHRLDAMTGVRYDRGRLGLWVQAEGAVYDNFSLEHNVTTEADYNPAWHTFWGCDDGYADGDGVGSPGHHPRVILVAQQRGDGGLNVFDEYYQTLQLPEQSIDEMLQRGYHKPRLAMVDSSAAEFRRRLGDRGIMNGGATHPVADGIKVVRRFICDGHGVRLLKIHPRCTNLIRELQAYRYDDKSSAVYAGEPKPLKISDHCPDSLRYLLWNFR